MVGFNPFREHQKTAFDIAMLVFAVLAVLAVIAWAIFAG
jgi:hypothetical protein